jgi:hypothetical protein
VDIVFGINPRRSVVSVAVMAGLTAVAAPAGAHGGDRIHAMSAVAGPVSVLGGDRVRTTTLKFDTDVVDYVVSLPGPSGARAGDRAGAATSMFDADVTSAHSSR